VRVPTRARVLVRRSVETPMFARWLGVYLDALPQRLRWPGAYSDAPGPVLVGLFCIIWPGVLLTVALCAQLAGSSAATRTVQSSASA